METSTCHAEHMVLGISPRETVWLFNVLEDLIVLGLKTTLYCNSRAPVKVATDLPMTKKSHHVLCEFHYVKEQIYNGVLELV